MRREGGLPVGGAGANGCAPDRAGLKSVPEPESRRNGFQLGCGPEEYLSDCGGCARERACIRLAGQEQKDATLPGVRCEKTRTRVPRRLCTCRDPAAAGVRCARSVVFAGVYLLPAVLSAVESGFVGAECRCSVAILPRVPCRRSHPCRPWSRQRRRQMLRGDPTRCLCRVRCLAGDGVLSVEEVGPIGSGCRCPAVNPTR